MPAQKGLSLARRVHGFGCTCPSHTKNSRGWGGHSPLHPAILPLHCPTGRPARAGASVTS